MTETKQPFVPPHSCGGCSRRWSGLAEAHCSVCHLQFSAVSSFDRHRVKGKCVAPNRVRMKDGRKVFVALERVNGITWALTGTDHWLSTPEQ